MGDTAPSSSLTLISKLDIGDPLYLHPSDSSSLTIVSIKLKGTENYAVWSSAMKLALEAKNKYGFINGKVERSKDDTVLAAQWDRCNSVVITWLLNSISEELFLGQVFSKLASEVWTDLRESFDKVDGSVVYDLYKKINCISQNGSTVAEYYNRLTTMWKQFDAMLHLPSCSCQAAKDYNDFSTLIKLMQFLMGLDDVYQPVRTNLLTREPFPSVKVAFSIISREESHRMSSNGSKNQNVSFVSKASQSFDNKRRPTRGPNPNLKCTHCNMLGHTVDRCFEIIGYPSGFRRRANNNSNSSNKVNSSSVSHNGNKSNSAIGKSAVSSMSGSPFTSEQITKLLSLVGENVGSESQNPNMGGECLNVSSFVSCSSFSEFNKSLEWIVDSGASQHMVNTDKYLVNSIDVSEFNITVSHPNGTKVKVVKIGNFELTKDIVLQDVFYVPDYCVNLLSVYKLAKDNCVSVVFNENSCLLQDSKSKKILMNGRQDSGLYVVGNAGNSVYACFNSSVKYATWHSRLGHPSDQVLAVLKQHLNLSSSEHGPCDVCHRAKQIRVPFSLSEHKTKAVGDLVHLDLWGPYKVTSYEGFKYFLTIVDDFSRSVWCYFVASKTEVFENLKEFYELVLTQFKKKIKIFRSDNGTEFVNNNMHMFCKAKGILHQTSCSYTPQQNGVVERKHRHLLNTARALMFQSGVPLRFWSDCILTAVYLINRLPSSVLNSKSPFEVMFGFKPSLSHLRNFGCLCFSTVLNDPDKFAFHADKCVFLGYSSVKKGYKLWSLDSKKIYFSRDVKFYETVYPFKLKNVNNQERVFELNLNHLNFFDNVTSEVPNTPDDEEGTSGAHDPVSDDQQPLQPSTSAPVSEVETDQPTEQVGSSSLGNSGGAEDTSGLTDDTILSEGTQSVRRSSRNVSMPKRFDQYVVEGRVKYGIEKTVNYSNLSVENMCFVSNLNKTVEPTCFSEAVKDPRWVEAMNKEMEALYKNGTWVLVNLPKDRKAIGCKWIYKVKYKSNGEIERFKARLVAKGFSQREGLDFGETFSPVVKMVTIRCVLSLAIKNNWKIYQLDVNNAFLYGSISEDVYMKLPPGYFSENETRVCKLVKSLYGLKQAPRQWNEKLNEVLLKMGFVQSLCDHSMYIMSVNSVFVVLLVYVDDIIVTGNSEVDIIRVKTVLSESFQIKDLGVLKYFLGIEVLYVDNGMCLSQRKYCLELLSEFGYLGVKPVNTPIEQSHVISHKLSQNQSIVKDVTGFQKLIGKLIYLSITRPDISYAVQFLSQFMHAPQECHLQIALRLLKYLKQSPGKGILFRKDNDFVLRGFVDSDWAKCLMSRKSVTGYSIFLGNAVVSWKSKKQSVVARSTAEAEYRAMCTACCEVMWILNLLKELRVECILPVKLFCDSKSAISIAFNPVFHERTKHFELDLHFLREKISAGIVVPEKVTSEQQLADLFTKGLNGSQHDVLCEQLGMLDVFTV
ncbi:putative RNA-directed DNA polymerase [Helianthus annuus]|nr:putative RNA-directed DNA polymerase [Helianthus annuus]